MNLTTTTFECKCCGHEIEVDLARLKPDSRAQCDHCNAIYGVDVDAEFVDGAWRDCSQLWRV